MASLPTLTIGDWVVDERWAVYGANNGKIGRVAAVHSDHLVVRDGVIHRRTRRVPVSAIRDIERECVYLNLSAPDLDACTTSA